jgi:hypothetical protein
VSLPNWTIVYILVHYSDQIPPGAAAHCRLHLTTPVLRLLDKGLIFIRTFVDALLCGFMIMQFTQWVSFSQSDRMYTKVAVVRPLYKDSNAHGIGRRGTR